MPNGRCRLHGGLTPAGIASPHFRTGRYSKYLPTHIQADFESAKCDPELVECSHELALIDSRMGQLAQRLQSGKDSEMWMILDMGFTELSTNFDSLLSFIEIEDEEGQTALKDTTRSLEACRHTINEVRVSESTWREMYALLEQRRKQVETETKRLKDLQQNITAERAMVLIGTLADIVRRHVTDGKQLAAISAELIQLTAGNARREADAA